MTLDPFSVYAGKLIYEVWATDNENDDITYTCSVASTFIPLECDSTQSNYAALSSLNKIMVYSITAL